MTNQYDLHEGRPKESFEISPYTFKEPPKENETKRNGALQLFRHYCTTTSLGGFVFFSEKRTCMEYLWWSIALILSMCGACYMIYEIYIKWLNSPVIVSFATKNLPISEIPFPAVTICPVIKINKSYFNLSRYTEDKYSTEDEATKKEMNKAANYMSVICQDYRMLGDNYIDPDDFLRVFYENTPNLKNISVVFKGLSRAPFSSIFKETYTQSGLCYTGNRMRLDEIYSDNVAKNERHYGDFGPSSWTPSSGYQEKPKSSIPYPYQAKGAGFNKGVHIFLAEQAYNNDLNCYLLFEGYTITLHSPSTIPRTEEEFVFLPADNAVMISMSPSFVMTSERVRNYPPEKRDCYFEGEKRLKFFKIYSRKNCELECLTNATLAACDCVEIYLPRENGTKVCGPRKRTCAKKVKHGVNVGVKKSSTYEYGIHREGENMQSYPCGCLPMCTDISYGAQIEPLDVSPRLMTHLKRKIDGLVNISGVAGTPSFQFSIASLYFKSDRVETTQRSELYGPSDFISNFGGLMGLFCGFSLLSLVEIVYYLSLRIIGNIKLFGYWAGSPDGQN